MRLEQSGKADTKNTLDSGEEDFYVSLAMIVGIGMIGTADLSLRENGILHRAHRESGWTPYKRKK